MDENKEMEHTHDHSTMHGPHPPDKKILTRFKSIEGQVRGIRRMLEEEKYCIDILNQISAVRAALNKAGTLILKRHIETCVTNAIKSGDQSIIDELMGVLDRTEI